jgi:hypothetical protein
MAKPPTDPDDSYYKCMCGISVHVSDFLGFLVIANFADEKYFFVIQIPFFFQFFHAKM